MIWFVIILAVLIAYVNSKQHRLYSKRYPETRGDLDHVRIDHRLEQQCELVKAAVESNLLTYCKRIEDYESADNPIYHPNAPDNWRASILTQRSVQVAAVLSAAMYIVVVDGVMRAVNHGHGIYSMFLPLFHGSMEHGELAYVAKSEDIVSLAIAIAFAAAVRSYLCQSHFIEGQIQGYLDGYYDGYALALSEATALESKGVQRHS